MELGLSSMTYTFLPNRWFGECIVIMGFLFRPLKTCSFIGDFLNHLLPQDAQVIIKLVCVCVSPKNKRIIRSWNERVRPQKIKLSMFGSIWYSKTVTGYWSMESFSAYSVYNNIHHPSKLAVGADFHCFKNKIEPKWEDPVCASGGKWTMSFSRGKSDTCWLYTVCPWCYIWFLILCPLWLFFFSAGMKFVLIFSAIN